MRVTVSTARTMSITSMPPSSCQISSQVSSIRQSSSSQSNKKYWHYCRRAAFALSGVTMLMTSISMPGMLGIPGIPGIQRSYAAPPKSYDTITARGIQSALDHGNVDELIGMIAHADQELEYLNRRVEGERQAVDKSILNAQSAQNQARLAQLSVKGAQLQKQKADDDVARAQARLNKILQRAYAAGVTPAILIILSSQDDNSDDLLDQSSVLSQLVRTTHKALKEYKRKKAIADYNASVSQSSLTQANIAVANAKKEYEKAQKEMSNTLTRVNTARNKRRELVLEKSMAQAAYDSLTHYSSITEQQKSYTDFQYVLKDRLYKESGVAQPKPGSGGKTVIKISGEQTPMVEFLSRELPALPRHTDTPHRRPHQPPMRHADLPPLNNIPFIKDIPFSGLLSGPRAINPVSLASKSLHAFLSTLLAKSGNPVSNVVTGVVHALEVPLDGISQALGLPSLGIPGLHTHYTPTPQHQVLFGSEGVEAVVHRAISALGVPYAWGGGNYNGPTKGIHDGGVADSYGDYKKVGFDCSGLMVYSFAAAGFHLPHYSGYQYNSGTKIPLKQMRRGDMIFYGPGGSQHVALILGDGTMIEAPESGSVVQISQVRTSGAERYVVRMIN